MAKDYFNQNKIEFTELDVATDLEARQDMMNRSGQMGVPQILIGDDLVIGFDKPRIDILLGLSGK